MKRLALGLALALPVHLACGDDETTPPDHTHEPMALTVKFAAKVGTRNFACGESYTGIAKTATSTWSPQDFRFYVDNVRLVGAEGEEELTLDTTGANSAWQHGTLALLDFENKQGDCSNGTAETRDQVVGMIHEGEYDRIRFTVGVPFAMNHQDVTTAPAPLNLSAMFWSWNAGYKFLKIDGKTSGLPGYNIHLGSTGCTGNNMGQVDSCTNANRVEVELSGYDPGTSVVVLDLAALVAEANIDKNTPATAPGCMSAPTDPECMPIFTNLGLPMPGVAAGAQRVFKLE
ncbi:MAG: metallo-mystery pair system four-Cys motif protein [Deltaproteobacteria bacterium]|nr:metallo-mystery pair system four-Cys motif protein [Deltaproteobacteria bacterium]